MGIKRGNFEGVSLGALAQSANPSYHQHATVASGLGALAQGVMAYAKSWGYITEGLSAWGKVFSDLGDKAVAADAQNKENRRKYTESAMRFNEEVSKRGLTENDADYWVLHDDMERWKWRTDHQSLFGVYSSPQPAANLSQEQKKSRRSALGLKSGVDNRTGRGYGFWLDWDGEEN